MFNTNNLQIYNFYYVFYYLFYYLLYNATKNSRLLAYQLVTIHGTGSLVVEASGSLPSLYLYTVSRFIPCVVMWMMHLTSLDTIFLVFSAAGWLWHCCTPFFFCLLQFHCSPPNSFQIFLDLNKVFNTNIESYLHAEIFCNLWCFKFITK